MSKPEQKIIFYILFIAQAEYLTIYKKCHVYKLSISIFSFLFKWKWNQKKIRLSHIEQLILKGKKLSILNL